MEKYSNHRSNAINTKKFLKIEVWLQENSGLHAHYLCFVWQCRKYVSENGQGPQGKSQVTISFFWMKN